MITIKKEPLLQAIKICNAMYSPKSGMQIFQQTKLHIDYDDKKLHILCHNEKIFYAYSIDFDCENTDMGDEHFFVDTKDLYDCIKQGKDLFTIDINEKAVKFSSGFFEQDLRVYTIGAEDIKELEINKSAIHIKVATKELMGALKLATKVPDEKCYDPVFGNLCFRFDNNKLFLLATDRFRAATAKLGFDLIEGAIDKDSKEEYKSYLVPNSAFQIFEKNFNAKIENEVLDIFFDDSAQKNLLKIPTKAGVFYFRLSDMCGGFPDTKKILPINFDTDLIFNASDMIQAIKLIYHIVKLDRLNKTLKLETKIDQNLIILSANNENKEVTTQLNYIRLTGTPDIVQTFNADYLLDYLLTFDGGNAIWRVQNDRVLPVVLYKEGEEEEQKSYLLSLIKEPKKTEYN